MPKAPDRDADVPGEDRPHGARLRVRGPSAPAARGHRRPGAAISRAAGGPRAALPAPRAGRSPADPPGREGGAAQPGLADFTVSLSPAVGLNTGA
jgi:hypothetical protein